MRIGVFTLVGNCWEQLCAVACSHWLGTVGNSCAPWRVHIGWELLGTVVRIGVFTLVGNCWEQLCAVACSQKSVHNIVFSLVANCRNALRKL